MDAVGLKLARIIEKKGFKAYHQMSSRGRVDNRSLMSILELSEPVKHIAMLAGLAVSGYNSLIITSDYEPRVRLGAIVTDAVMKAYKILKVEFCSSCRTNGSWNELRLPSLQKGVKVSVRYPYNLWA